MKLHRLLIGLLVLFVAKRAAAAPDRRDPEKLTLEDARAIARDCAPALAAARAEVGVAEATLERASIFSPFNPMLRFGAGPRFDRTMASADIDASISQRFELGGHRSVRIDGANAQIAMARARSENALRGVLFSVSVAFVQALHAEAALAVASESASVADALLQVIRRKNELGEIGGLDVNVAFVSCARTSALHQRIAAKRARALGQLRAHLGFAHNQYVAVQGSLEARPALILKDLLEALKHRPDLQGLRAEAQRARAQEELGNAKAWPDVGVFARFGREEGANIVGGGVRIWLPVFDRGQALVATGAAQRKAARLRLETALRTASADLAGRFAAYRHLEGAVEKFEKQALPRLLENLRLAQEAYQSGAIPIGELLSIQREMVDARMAYVDLLLEANLATLELQSRAGILR